MKRIYNPTQRKRILIVDDDQAVASIYQNKLRTERFEVDIACDCESALLKIQIASIDLVILDLSLLGIDGVEVLKAIRSQSGTQRVPVIVFSNTYVPGLMQAVSEAGATRSVRKSDYTPRQMVAIVREVLAASATVADSPTPGEVISDVELTSTPATDTPVENGEEALQEEFEMEYQAKLVANFFAKAPQKLAGLRTGHHAFTNIQKENQRPPELSEMHRQARLLAGAAGVGGFRTIARLADALAALLVELDAKPTKITASVIRTVAQAIDTLASLFEQATTPQLDASPPPKILVVDDEIISRETICSALGRADLPALSLDNSLAAQRLLEQEHFDLIFLDVEMPGENGLDLCVNIREMATNRATPVVFVTSHSDFGSRAQSTLSGGSDFIAKPFLSVELAVKALSWLSKEPLQPIFAATLGGPVDNIIDHSPALEATTALAVSPEASSKTPFL